MAEVEVIPCYWLGEEVLLTLPLVNSAQPQFHVVAVPVDAPVPAHAGEAAVAERGPLSAPFRRVLSYFRPQPAVEAAAVVEANPHLPPPPPEDAAQPEAGAVRELLGDEPLDGQAAAAGYAAEPAFVHVNPALAPVELPHLVEQPLIAAEGGRVRASMRSLIRFFAPSTLPLVDRAELHQPLAEPQQVEEEVELGRAPV